LLENPRPEIAPRQRESVNSGRLGAVLLGDVRIHDHSGEADD
jgi:hypothetical protein